MVQMKYYSNLGIKYEAPERDGSANMDIHCAEDFELEQGVVSKVRTGLWVDVPPGFVLEIYPRSGLAASFGMTLVNSPCQIDPGYKDEIILIVTSLSRITVINPKRIKKNKRVAQARIVPTGIHFHPTPVDTTLFELGMPWKQRLSLESLYKDSKTPDRKGGLGSTGN